MGGTLMDRRGCRRLQRRRFFVPTLHACRLASSCWRG
jgi:hypothetical protein